MLSNVSPLSYSYEDSNIGIVYGSANSTNINNNSVGLLKQKTTLNITLTQNSFKTFYIGILKPWYFENITGTPSVNDWFLILRVFIDSSGNRRIRSKTEDGWNNTITKTSSMQTNIAISFSLNSDNYIEVSYQGITNISLNKFESPVNYSLHSQSSGQWFNWN